MEINFKTVKDGIRKTYQKVFHVSTSDSKEEQLRSDLESARNAWKYAENHFREVTDTELIDQAIYDMMSAKCRYSYLMKKAKKESGKI